MSLSLDTAGGSKAARPAALWALAFGAVSGALLQTLVLPLLPLFPAIFQTDIAAVSWIATSSMLVGALSAPLLGWIGDRYGAKHTILGVLILMGIGAVISALAETLTVMLIGRVLQGFAIGIVGLSLALLRHTWPKESLPSAIGVVSGSVGVGTAFGVPFSGLVVGAAPWQSVFWIMAVAAFGAAGLIAWLVPSTLKGMKRSFDAWGALGLGAVVIVFLLAPSRTSHIESLLMLLASVVGAGLWFAYEKRVKSPFVDPGLLSKAPLLACHGVVMCLGFGFFLSFTATISLAQLPAGGAAGLGGTVLTTGWVQLPASLATIVTPLFAGHLARRFDALALLRWGILVVVAGFGFRAVFLTEPVTMALGAMLVSGAITFCFAALAIVLMRHSPLEKTASANGLNMLFRQIGASLASAGGAAILARFIDFSAPASATGFYWLFGLGACACLLAYGAVLLLSTSRN